MSNKQKNKIKRTLKRLQLISLVTFLETVDTVCGTTYSKCSESNQYRLKFGSRLVSNGIQLLKGRRHTNQLVKCFETKDLHNAIHCFLKYETITAL